MRTVSEAMDELQRTAADWVLWAHRLEALVLATPVPCRCWDNNGRTGTQGHIGLCAEWSAVAAAIRTKPKMVAGPLADDSTGGQERGEVRDGTE